MSDHWDDHWDDFVTLDVIGATMAPGYDGLPYLWPPGADWTREKISKAFEDYFREKMKVAPSDQRLRDLSNGMVTVRDIADARFWLFDKWYEQWYEQQQ
jgi:hypothetical protein